MKTILRLTVILIVVALVGVALYFFFQNPTVQGWLRLESGFGHGRWNSETNRGSFPNWENEPRAGEIQKQGFSRGKGEGRGFGAGRGQGAGFESSEHPNKSSSLTGWLGLLGILLRLAILMAVVIGLVKIVRWLGRKIKADKKMETQAAKTLGNPNL